jgi:hypothetical protein
MGEGSCRWLPGPVRCFEYVAQSGETVLPLGALGGEPVLGSPESRRLEAARAHAADLLRGDEARMFEDAEVLDDGGERHVQGCGKLTHRRRTADQALHHGAPGRVGQRVEDPVELGQTVRHFLNYRAHRDNSQVIT